jgi:hypothetical protein
MEPILILVLVGAFGGSVRSILGYFNQSDTDEKFDFQKFLYSFLRGAIAGSGLSYITYNTANINPSVAAYIGAFILSVGADVLIKELYGTVTELNK